MRCKIYGYYYSFMVDNIYIIVRIDIYVNYNGGWADSRWGNKNVKSEN